MDTTNYQLPTTQPDQTTGCMTILTDADISNYNSSFKHNSYAFKSLFLCHFLFKNIYSYYSFATKMHCPVGTCLVPLLLLL